MDFGAAIATVFIIGGAIYLGVIGVTYLVASVSGPGL